MIHQALPPFACWSGPRDARVVLLGEAWGQSELEVRKPFAGESGKELWRMIGEAWPLILPEEHQRVEALHRYGLAWVRQREGWLQEASCAMTNVLNLRPPGNKLEQLCQPKASLPAGYQLSSLVRGGYLAPEYLPELDRLREELATCKPNLVIALGNTACWALLQATNISQVRGTVSSSQFLNGWSGEGYDSHYRFPLKTLPTYHPAAVLRMWQWRVIVVADLIKGLRESASSELVRPTRQVLFSPTLTELRAWTDQTLAKPPPLLACDIETGAGQIKCIGFARARDDAIVVPFVDQVKPGYSFWDSPSEEEFAWLQVQRLLESEVPKVFQNGLYDLQYLLRVGLRPRACAEDTMLLHHSWFPELQKGLGFLGSIYSNEPAWKLMRRHRPDSEKRDE